jgi:hypothetical protein
MEPSGDDERDAHLRLQSTYSRRELAGVVDGHDTAGDGR